MPCPKYGIDPIPQKKSKKPVGRPLKDRRSLALQQSLRRKIKRRAKMLEKFKVNARRSLHEWNVDTWKICIERIGPDGVPIVHTCVVKPEHFQESGAKGETPFKGANSFRGALDIALARVYRRKIISRFIRWTDELSKWGVYEVFDKTGLILLGHVRALHIQTTKKAGNRLKLHDGTELEIARVSTRAARAENIRLNFLERQGGEA